ncbi:hypothetical protein [Streptomyces werraensis]|uniref:hypothetical protein n=1 Tax=Streptomyces werraensis TaxID=68284 RepID=UPI0037FA1FE6
MILELNPPTGAGPLRLGMTMTEAEEALRRIEGYVGGDTSLQANPGVGRYSSGLTIHAHPALSGGLVEAIEVYRPHQDSVQVCYDGIDVLGLPAAEVLNRLRDRDGFKANEEGDVMQAKDLHLALWRPHVSDDDPDDEQGYFFQSALVAEPGYGI